MGDIEIEVVRSPCAAGDLAIDLDLEVGAVAGLCAAGGRPVPLVCGHCL